MKSTGIVRKLDQLGRITLPKELRITYGITEGSPLEIYTDGDCIIVKKFQKAEEVNVIASQLMAALLNSNISVSSNTYAELNELKNYQKEKRNGRT